MTTAEDRARLRAAWLAVATLLAAFSSLPVPASAAPPPEAARASDPLAAALAPKPGGLTPAKVAAAAATTSPTARAKHAELRAAAARVDRAFIAYFPRLTFTTGYLRLSPVENEIAIAPCPDDLTRQCELPASKAPSGAPLRFLAPMFLDNYSVAATLSVPVSDYVLRLTHAHAAAVHDARARQLEARAAARAAAADAEIAFYNWIKSKGQVVVAEQAIRQATAHVADARGQLELGYGSRADLLQLEAQLAGVEQLRAELEAFAELAEEQLRTLLHVPRERRLEIGVDVFGRRVPVVPPSLQGLVEEAARSRPEVQALEEARRAARRSEAVARAGYAPRLDAVAETLYANPNPRSIPLQNQWMLTWAAGVRLTWSVNETFETAPAVVEARARTTSLTHEKSSLMDALRIEVASAYAELRRATASLAASDRGLAAAEEALRVRRELFRSGKAGGTALIDAETELTRARLRRLDARIGALVAETRLRHAVGRGRT